MRHEQVVGVRRLGNRDDIVERIVLNRVDHGRYGVTAACDEQRVAVARGLGYEAVAYGPAATQPILDNELALQVLAQLDGDESPDRVYGAAHGQGRDDSYRFFGVRDGVLGSTGVHGP